MFLGILREILSGSNRGDMLGRREQPLDPTSGPVARLACELRKLRQEAGTPTYRMMAGRVHYSTATLAQAAAGDRLPSLAVTLAYVQACGGDREHWRRRWEGISEEVARGIAGGGRLLYVSWVTRSHLAASVRPA